MTVRAFHSKCWLVVVLLKFVIVPVEGQVVELMDGVLEGMIREAIGKDSGTLTVDDMSQLVELDVSVEKRGPNAPAIRNLKGLETAVHLQTLNLSGAFPLVFDVMQDPNSSWQCVCTDCAMGSEGPANLFDGQPTKWRGLVNSFGCAGFMMTPKDVSTHVQSIRLRSANDNPGKDPKMIVIEGSNDEDTRPSDYDYLSIQTSSFKDILQLVSKLLQGGDSLTKYLYSSISQVSRDLIRLAIDKKEVPSDLGLRLARDLNRIMSQPSFYTERRFRDVALRPETLALLDSPPDGITLVHLNRLLLEDAFPDALLHHRNPWQQIATVDVAPFGGRFQWQEVGFQNDTSYRHYRITVTETQDGERQSGYTDLSELQLLILRGQTLDSDEVDLSPIAYLPRLVRLNLSGNELSYFAPSEGTPLLEELDLSGNRLTDLTIPSEYQQLSYLKLSRNRLANLVLPDDLSLLIELNVSFNELAHIELPTGMTNLSRLILDHNQLTHLYLPDESASLQQLSATHNQLTHVSFPRDLKMSGGVDVSWLRFGFNRLTSLQLPPGLTELSDILELDMMLNPIQRLEIPFGMNPDMIWLLGATGVDHVFYIPFSLGRSEGMLELIWPEGVLQSVHSFGEDWTTVEGATSPYRFTPSTPHTFFRVTEE